MRGKDRVKMKDRTRKKMMKIVEKAHKKYVKDNETYSIEMKNTFNQRWNWSSNEVGDKAGEKYNNLLEYMYLYKKVIEKNPQQFIENGRNIKKLTDSLNSSIGCSYDNRYFKSCMKDLINNDPDSFLVVPIIYSQETSEHSSRDGHSVSLIIQKEDNKIKVRVCNKGGQLVPNERPLIDQKISVEKLDKIAMLHQWENWCDFSDTEKVEFWNSLSEQETSDCLNYSVELEKLWLDLDARQLKPIYVYVFEESKESIEAISKAIRIGRNTPKWRDMISLFRDKDVSLMTIFKDKNFLYYHKKIEYPLKKLHRHAMECKFENYAASSQMIGGCGVKNVGLAFKYVLGYKDKVEINKKEYDQCKQVKNLDQMLIKTAKEVFNKKDYSEFIENNYAIFTEKKRAFSNLPRAEKLVEKELFLNAVQEHAKEQRHIKPIDFKKVNQQVKQEKTSESYLLKLKVAKEYAQGHSSYAKSSIFKENDKIEMLKSVER